MGWWSASIMGGDTPLDAEIRIFKLLGLSVIQPHHNPAEELLDSVRIVLEAKQEYLINHFKSLTEKWDEDSINTGIQVVGILLMKYGSRIEESTGRAIVKACQEDEWAKDNDERKQYIDNFLQALEQYCDEAPVPTTTDGIKYTFTIT